jgi:hypothetical protein
LSSQADVNDGTNSKFVFKALPYYSHVTRNAAACNDVAETTAAREKPAQQPNRLTTVRSLTVNGDDIAGNIAPHQNVIENHVALMTHSVMPSKSRA